MLWSGGDPRMSTICLAKARLSLVVTLRVWVAPIVLATCSRPSSRSEGGEVRGGGRKKRAEGRRKGRGNSHNLQPNLSKVCEVSGGGGKSQCMFTDWPAFM